MTISVLRKKFALLGAALTASLFISAGCSKPQSPAASDGNSAAQNATAAAGSKMVGSDEGSGPALVAATCGCHSSGKAPSLAHIGSDPAHTPGWIAEYVNNPKSKDPNSRMPPLQGKVSSEDLTKIAIYLASQK